MPRGLGPTHPCPSTVHMETDSASVFCVPRRIIATTTKICTGYTIHVDLRLTLLLVPHALLRGSGLDLPVAGVPSVVGLSIVHFRGWCIRQVSCYTLLSRFRLPWPRPCCLNTPTPFMGSDEPALRYLRYAFGSSRVANSAYQKWPTWESDSSNSLNKEGCASRPLRV